MKSLYVYGPIIVGTSGVLIGTFIANTNSVCREINALEFDACTEICPEDRGWCRLTGNVGLTSCFECVDHGPEECKAPTSGEGACLSDCQGECVLDHTTDRGKECYRCELPENCTGEEYELDDCEFICAGFGECQYAYSTVDGDECYSCVDACDAPQQRKDVCESQCDGTCKYVSVGRGDISCYVCDDGAHCEAPYTSKEQCNQTCNGHCLDVGNECYECDECDEGIPLSTCLTSCTDGNCLPLKNSACVACVPNDQLCEAPSFPIDLCSTRCENGRCLKAGKNEEYDVDCYECIEEESDPQCEPPLYENKYACRSECDNGDCDFPNEDGCYECKPCPIGTVHRDECRDTCNGRCIGKSIVSICVECIAPEQICKPPSMLSETALSVCYQGRRELSHRNDLYDVPCYKCKDFEITCDEPYLPQTDCKRSCDGECEHAYSTYEGDCYECKAEKTEYCPNGLMRYTECNLRCNARCEFERLSPVDRSVQCFRCPDDAMVCPNGSSESKADCQADCETSCTGFNSGGQTCYSCMDEENDDNGGDGGDPPPPTPPNPDDFTNTGGQELCFDENLQPIPCE